MDEQDAQQFADSLPKRMKVLEETVKLEHNTAALLMQVFEIPSDNMSFGTTSKALSFDQKLNLFVDIGMLDKEQRKRFTLLQEMRNQFAHNFSTYTFEICLSRTSIPAKTLLKWYPPKDSSLHPEQQLEMAFEKMMGHIEEMLGEVVMKVMQRWKDRFESKVSGKGLNKFLKTREHIFEPYRKEVNRRSVAGETYTAAEVILMLKDILQKENDAINAGMTEE